MQKPWHCLTVAEAAAALATDPQRGLGEDEAEARLAKHGPNRLPEAPRRPAWRLLLRQFRSGLTVVLLGAAVIAGAVGDLLDMAVILAVVVFNALLGFYQEFRAERILEALRGMLAEQTTVRRQGEVRRIAADRLVPGDLVVIEAGARVPADGRLVATHALEVDESALTGESAAVGKQVEPLADVEAPLGDRTNLAFTNTVVTRGRGEMIVTATGAATEIGRLAGMLQATPEPETPLQRRLDHLGKRLGTIAVVVAGLVLVMGLMRAEPLTEVALTAIALAVAAIPEGLPAVVTVTLAIGMYRMTRRNAIVKRLAAVETLGSTTVICSDKTGTLTLNQMTARRLSYRGRVYDVSGEGYATAGAIKAAPGESVPDLRPLLLPAVLCNDSRIAGGRLLGDPTEGALLVLAAKGGVGDERERLPRLAEVPFDPATKFMATFHVDGDRVAIYAKGAPDVLLRRCTRLLVADGEVALDDEGRAAVLAEVERFGGEALRVLALAYGSVPAGRFRPEAAAEMVEDLTLAGLVGILDPPRAEAREAVAACRRAGIAVKMITGDHKVTARAIASALGLEGEAVTGAELDRMNDAELAARIEGIAVFARVAPEHKVRIVSALKDRGHVVAMTGDGVNDAPALKSADIGVAMGRAGTDVAREAGTLVLTDDNFATIVGAVQEGRTIYDNILKFLRFQLSTNVGALMTVGAAPFLALPVPFNPIQILWVNIIMDGPPAMALGFDPPRERLMEEPPRPPSQPILTGRRMMRLLAYGATMAVGTLALFWYGLRTGTPEYARTLAFTAFVLFQFFNVFNARVSGGSAFNRTFFRNGKLWLALAGVLGLQWVAVHWPPAQAVFHTTSLGLADWLAATAVASSVLILDEARKLGWRLFRALARR